MGSAVRQWYPLVVTGFLDCERMCDGRRGKRDRSHVKCGGLWGAERVRFGKRENPNRAPPPRRPPNPTDLQEKVGMLSAEENLNPSDPYAGVWRWVALGTKPVAKNTLIVLYSTNHRGLKRW